jgi:hypothetical protein
MYFQFFAAFAAIALGAPHVDVYPREMSKSHHAERTDSSDNRVTVVQDGEVIGCLTRTGLWRPIDYGHCGPVNVQDQGLGSKKSVSIMANWVTPSGSAAFACGFGPYLNCDDWTEYWDIFRLHDTTIVLPGNTSTQSVFYSDTKPVGNETARIYREKGPVAFELHFG